MNQNCPEEQSFFDYLVLFFPLVRSCKIFCYHNTYASVSPVVVVTLAGFLVQAPIFSVLFPELPAARVMRLCAILRLLFYSKIVFLSCRSKGTLVNLIS